MTKTRKGFSEYLKFCKRCKQRYITPLQGSRICNDCKENNRLKRNIHIHTCKRCDEIFRNYYKTSKFCKECIKPKGYRGGYKKDDTNPTNALSNYSRIQ